jgi:hypothetical protein
LEKTIEIWLDEELQIIRQRLTGNLDESDNGQLVAGTQACVDRMKDPKNVRILINAQGLGRPNTKMRKILIEEQKRTDLKKMAIWGGSLLMRTALKFFSLADANSKVRHFATEHDALEWLRG